MTKTDITIEIKALPVEDGADSITFEGYLATWDQDKAGDIFAKGAFSEDVGKTFKVFWDHGWTKGKPPIGSLIVLEEDENGVKVLGILPLEDEFVEGRIAPHLKSGTIKEMSVGFTSQKINTRIENGIRTILKASMMEGSLVNFPCNTSAIITAVKSEAKWDDLPKAMADRSYIWNEADAEARIKEKSEKLADFYLMKTDTGNKFLIADVIDGNIMAVPRAIFAARSILAGAKGGADASDSSEVKELVNKYYDLMGLDQPFISGNSEPFTLTELKCLQKSLLQEVLKKYEICNSAIKHLVTVISAQEVQVSSTKDENLELAAVDLAFKSALNQLEINHDRSNYRNEGDSR